MYMSREEFKELFGLEEGDDGLTYADEDAIRGESYWQIAKDSIAIMDLLLRERD